MEKSSNVDLFQEGSQNVLNLVVYQIFSAELKNTTTLSALLLLAFFEVPNIM